MYLLVTARVVVLDGRDSRRVFSRAATDVKEHLERWYGTRLPGIRREMMVDRRG